MRCAFLSGLALLCFSILLPLGLEAGPYSWSQAVETSRERDILFLGAAKEGSRYLLLGRGRLFKIETNGFEEDLAPFLSEVTEFEAPRSFRNHNLYHWRVRTPSSLQIDRFLSFLESGFDNSEVPTLFDDLLDPTAGVEIELVSDKKGPFLSGKAELTAQLIASGVTFGYMQLYPRFSNLETLEGLSIGYLVSLLAVESGLQLSKFWRQKVAPNTAKEEDRLYQLVGVGSASLLVQQGVMCGYLLSLF